MDIYQYLQKYRKHNTFYYYSRFVDFQICCNFFRLFCNKNCILYILIGQICSCLYCRKLEIKTKLYTACDIISTKHYLNCRKHFQAKCNALHFAICYRCVCVSVSVCVCMPRLWTSGKLFEIEPSFFFELRGITPDIRCKSLTQIELQIPRWRTKWRP